MKLNRTTVCTLALAVVFAALVTPVYKELAAQLLSGASGLTKWVTVAFLYAVQGASSVYAARRVSRWIFAHATDGKRASL